MNTENAESTKTSIISQSDVANLKKSTHNEMMNCLQAKISELIQVK